MLRIILKILTFTFLFFVNPSVAQEIRRESFSIPGKGLWGNENGNIESDFSGIKTWTPDTSGIQPSNREDYAKTVATAGGRFECRDIDGREPSPPVIKGDIVINEVLFNPFPGGEDFVEIYNCSQKEIHAETLYLANRDKNMKLNKIYPVTDQHFPILPHSYLAITTDKVSLDQWYIIKQPDCIIENEKMPSYNNDEGFVVLLNEDMEVIDEFHYNENMHSLFLYDEEGVSLERCSFSDPSNDPDNWHSASTSSSYGTPGYENSQIEGDNEGAPEISFETREFSPNSDGFNDELLIRYDLGKPGFMANIKIFDVKGRFIMHLINNEIVNTSGTISWNGEDKTGSLQLPGAYIIFIEFYNAKGEVFKFKDAAILTGRIN